MPRLARLDARPPRPPASPARLARLSLPRNRTQPWQWRAGLSSRPACHRLALHTAQTPACVAMAGRWRAGTWGITSRYYPRVRASQDIYSRSRQKIRAEARSLFCYWAVRELGCGLSELGRRLSMSQPGVGYAVSRGERIAKQNNYQLLD